MCGTGGWSDDGSGNDDTGSSDGGPSGGGEFDFTSGDDWNVDADGGAPGGLGYGDVGGGTQTGGGTLTIDGVPQQNLVTAPVQGFPRAKISVAPFRAAPGPPTVGIAGKSPEEDDLPSGIPGPDPLTGELPSEEHQGPLDTDMPDNPTFDANLGEFDNLEYNGLKIKDYGPVNKQVAVNMARQNVAPINDLARDAMDLFGDKRSDEQVYADNLATIGLGAGVDNLDNFIYGDPTEMAESEAMEFPWQPSSVGLLAKAIESITGNKMTSMGKNSAGQGMFGHTNAGDSLANTALGLGLSNTSFISPEDEFGYDAGGEMDELNVGNGPSGPAPVAAPPPVVENPAGLNLTGTPGQQLAQMSTFAVAGGAGQGPSRSEGGQDFFKQLVRQVYGGGGELAGEANIRPIDLQYAREVLGLSEDGEREAFLRAIG